MELNENTIKYVGYFAARGWAVTPALSGDKLKLVSGNLLVEIEGGRIEVRAREHRQTLLASASLADEADYANFLSVLEELKLRDMRFNLLGEIESLEESLRRKRAALSDLDKKLGGK